MGKVLLPAKSITCPVFVGTELYITSASDKGLSEFGGDVFKVDVGVKGVGAFKFKIDEGVSKMLKK